MSEPRGSDDLGPGAAHPDAAGWVLGALDPAEVEEFAVHLEDCEPCRQAVRDLQATRALLEVAAPPVEVPVGLQARTLRAVELAAQQDRLRAGRRRRSRWLAAAAAVVVLGVGGLGWSLRDRAAAEPTVTIAMTAPGGGSATGEAHGHETPHGWSIGLSAWGLPEISDGRGHYECWYVAADDTPTHRDAVSAGSFEVLPDGTATDVQMWAALELDQPGWTMIVTREPDNNPELTGPVVLSGPVRT